MTWKQWLEIAYVLFLLVVLGVDVTMIIIILAYMIRALIGPV